ncbi:family 10 glycosylhydrolase, partial [Candidatus Saccharibacteria bacterium]|nr:family 10 glycosylhydrolase [Candidatus Saccharibacteria bacterium]NIW00509.1 family 10 glycosylhydrolase [Candidatus Saccharibacteria bacterium]NIW80851.1 family 10 glycosylhydrolase [Calditrichia bacterium]
MLEIADRLQFTDLFVQVRGRGDAYYQSQYEPLAEGLEADFDPLTYLLEKSKQYDFRIHAWINVFYLWSKERLPESEQHILHRKPEWLVRPIDYDSSAADSNLNHLRNGEGLYHSPLIDEVRQHILDVVNDLLSRYQLAGLHLDYIRYPDERFDFNPVARKNFQREYLLDPLEFKKYPDQFIQSHGNVGYELFFSHWAEFLRNELSEFVEALSANVRAKFPGVTISAAVKPDLERAHWRYYQAWDTWLRQGWLDWALPMNYADDNDRFLRRIRQMIKAVDMNKILMGIAL